MFGMRFNEGREIRNRVNNMRSINRVRRRRPVEARAQYLEDVSEESTTNQEANYQPLTKER